jgi:hypothetical protein
LAGFAVFTALAGAAGFFAAFVGFFAIV